AAGCGPKRPPASSTGSGARARTTAPSGSETTVDSGPELHPLDSDSASGADMFSDSSGEGGPLADVYFEYDQSALTDATRATLAQHATWIKGHASARIT